MDTTQLDRIEAILDVLLTLEKQRRAKEYNRQYEEVVFEIERMLLEAQTAAVARRGRKSD